MYTYINTCIHVSACMYMRAYIHSARRPGGKCTFIVRARTIIFVYSVYACVCVCVYLYMYACRCMDIHACTVNENACMRCLGRGRGRGRGRERERGRGRGRDLNTKRDVIFNGSDCLLRRPVCVCV